MRGGLRKEKKLKLLISKLHIYGFIRSREIVPGKQVLVYKVASCDDLKYYHSVIISHIEN